MAVLGVKIKNFKKHKDLNLVLDGKTTFFCGDAGGGKTTVIDLIRAANMQTEFPTNPLTDNEESGAVEIIQDMDGKKYRIFRKFKKGDNGRWEIRNEDGSKPAKPLTEILSDMLGRALKNSYFDYITYFFGLKSPEARYDYFVNAVGGQEVAENNKKITDKKKERAVFGNQRKQQEAIYMQMGTLDKDQLVALSKLYKDEKTSDDADKAYDNVLADLKDIKEIGSRLEIVTGEVKIRNGSKEAIPNLQNRIEDLERQLEDLKKQKQFAESNLIKYKNIDSDYKKVLSEYEAANDHNKSTIDKADAAYRDEVDKVIIFNSNRKTFIDSVKALQEFTRVDKEWNIINDEIGALEAENSELFKNKLPIPELSVSAIEKTKSNGDVEVKEMIMYNGREFSFDELSKGESIEIAVKIQKALNPKGNNFIVLPEANLLGSKLDDILEVCKKQNIQALVEITQRKQEFKIIFEEEFLNS